MNTKETRDFFEALQLLGQEKGISPDYLVEKITNAIVIAVKRDYQVTDNVNVTINPEKGIFTVSITKMVVDEYVEDPETEILLDEAIAYDPAARVVRPSKFSWIPRQFGRIAAQTAKHVIRQGIREANVPRWWHSSRIRYMRLSAQSSRKSNPLPATPQWKSITTKCCCLKTNSFPMTTSRKATASCLCGGCRKP